MSQYISSSPGNKIKSITTQQKTNQLNTQQTRTPGHNTERVIIFRSNNTFAFLWKSIYIGKGGKGREQQKAEVWEALESTLASQKQREKLSNPDPYLHLLLSL
jgi:hypothetical protein